jgi:hypothetical protein
VLIGLLGYVAAAEVAASIRVGVPLLKPVWDSRRLWLISMASGAVGLFANMALAVRVSEQYEGVTVAEYFVPFLHLSLIASVARAIVRTNGRRGIDLWVIAILAAELTFAFVRNSRMAIFEVFLCYLVTIAAFRGKVNGRQVAGFGIALVSIAIITPIMLYVRDIRSELTWVQRIEATVDALGDSREAIAAYEAARELGRKEGFYLQYYDAPENVLERMSLVNHVDVLKSGTDSTRQLGVEELKEAMGRVLPRFLAPEKPRDHSHGDWAYCEVGARCHFGTFATAPLIGAGYAGYGWAGVLLYPFIFGLPVLLIIKKAVGWNIVGNIWAIYLLIRVHDQFVEGSTDAYMNLVARELPQELVLLWMIGVAAATCSLRLNGRPSTTRAIHG